MQIEIIDEQSYLNSSTKEQLERLVQRIGQVESCQSGELAISIVDNNMIQELNRTYRGKDVPTDVLSFPLLEDEAGEADLLGDVVISFPKAEEQAKQYGHSIQRELGFLVAHGFLHILGYDHDTDANEKVMFERQESILNEFGLTR